MCRTETPILRGIAAYSGRGPVDVLRGLNATMHTLAMPFTATPVTARIEPPTAGIAGVPFRLRWSNAGHPPRCCCATRESSATVVSTLLYLSPPTTMLWAFAMFGDPLTPAGLAEGLVISALGVLLVLRAGRSG